MTDSSSDTSVPEPESLPTFIEHVGGHAERLGVWAKVPRPIDVRYVGEPGWVARGDRPVEPAQRVWMRVDGRLPDDPMLHACALTYASDLTLLDAVLSTHVIGLANTAFYGLTGKVSSAWHAVGVLGPATVRAIATAAAFDLFSDERRSVPGDFWAHSVTTAAAAAAIARRIGTQPNDAFSAGLLHDLGAALVFRRAPRRCVAC